MLRMRNLSNEEHLELLAHLETGTEKIQELQYTTIGPTVGASLKKRAGWALVIASLAIIVYLAAAFRKIPGRMSPWSFGVAAVVALLHDIIITVGVFIIIGWYTTFEVDTLYVSALLSIMGYSVNDTIVIFDRIRSNLVSDGKRESLESIVDRSLRDPNPHSQYRCRCADHVARPLLLRRRKHPLVHPHTHCGNRDWNVLLLLHRKSVAGVVAKAPCAAQLKIEMEN